MRLAFLIIQQHHGTGGLENVLTTMYRKLTARGHFCKVYFSETTLDRAFPFSFENSFLSPAIPKLMREKAIWRPRALYRFYTRTATHDCLQQILADSIDAVLVLNLTASFQRQHTIFQNFHAEHPEIPLIAYPHGKLDYFHKAKYADKQYFSVFSAALAISSGIADSFHELAPTLPVHVIYNPIRPAAAAIPRSAQTTRFVYIGRLDRDKRITEMLQILASLHGDWRLDIIGSGIDKSYNREIDALLQQEPYRSCVSWHGWQENPWEHIESASALLLHSRSEGLPLVLIEAIERGIPCVAADCPTGPADIIQDGSNGWLYPVDDEEMCRTILQEILDGKRPLPASEDVRKTAEKFHIDAVVTRTEQALQHILQTHPR